MQFDYDRSDISQKHWPYMFTLPVKLSCKSAKSFFATCIQNADFDLLLAAVIYIESPPLSKRICHDVLSTYGSNIVENGPVVFR